MEFYLNIEYRLVCERFLLASSSSLFCGFDRKHPPFEVGREVLKMELSVHLFSQRGLSFRFSFLRFFLLYGIGKGQQ